MLFVCEDIWANGLDPGLTSGFSVEADWCKSGISIKLPQEIILNQNVQGRLKLF